jgi:hypothetical protein
VRALSFVVGFLAGLTFAASSVHAGTACEAAPPSPEKTARATAMAERTLAALNQGTDEVSLIARVGQDLSRYGLEYSHVAFVVRTAQGWSVVHELNDCGTANSALYDQGLIEFFSDSPAKYQAGVWRLTPTTQGRLKRALAGKTASRLHEPSYSMVSYPFSTQFQNSNQWVLEVLAYALAPEDEVATRQDAQEWLKAQGYVPTQLEIDAPTRLGARLAKANVSFADHPPELRWSGHIRTTSVKALVEFLKTAPDACAKTDCPETTVVLP